MRYGKHEVLGDQRKEFGAIFVDSRYGSLHGPLPMSIVNLENATRQNNGQPEVVASFAWNDQTSVQSLPGIEFESVAGQRGMHGSFGTDVHNTRIANGPLFKTSSVVVDDTAVGVRHREAEQMRDRRNDTDASRCKIRRAMQAGRSRHRRSHRPRPLPACASSCRRTRPARPPMPPSRRAPTRSIWRSRI
ncbi:protein of unknown function (plasmid) [Caballeronia sp. S22]